MRVAIPILTVAILTAGARPAAAVDSVDAELAVAAGDIAKYLKALGAKSVAVGQIRSTADEKISHGPGLAVRLNERLAAAGLKVEKDARYVVVGEYADKKDAKS